MPKADFAHVLQELEALESELEPMRPLVDEGEERLRRAPTARAAAWRQLESAVGHALESARALIAEAEWEEPEEAADAILVLVENDVLPERIGNEMVEITEFTVEQLDEEGSESEDLFDRLAQGAETLTEYVEYVHHFLKSWGE